MNSTRLILAPAPVSVVVALDSWLAPDTITYAMVPFGSVVKPTTNSVSRGRKDPGSQATSAPKHGSYSPGVQIVPVGANGAPIASIPIGSMAFCSCNC